MRTLKMDRAYMIYVSHESQMAHLRPDIPVVEMDCEINAPEFAEACAKALIKEL
ncbi:MAG: hypothetical protein OJI67_04845 [Prosthecobacter sp.]|nr:hypothetical protein [Prosthecobacter sp.]